MTPKINPELLPLIEWWEKDGKQTVICLVIAGLLVGGWYGFKAYKANVKSASSQALVSAITTQEIEDAVSKYGSTPTGGALKLRLAKKYFDEDNFEQAMSVYDELAKGAPEGFADIPAVGKAYCLEGLKKFAEAQAAFDVFAEANPTSYLALTAKLGAARCLAQTGDKKAALERLDALKDASKDDALATARIDSLRDLIKRS